ncbi:zinc transporter ZntB [Mariluticola halotolerans]|uniref:zinc transporter ZntB n=1 Tax=Mariluticola halotolerans TaxID=2909283 RepID=UPI0026E3E593|nr:zinc transporter ZntB [Mariluticola halotolerans]UJQ94374.1 zinc transporter ZntB [Mariluticola halotolerans]
MALRRHREARSDVAIQSGKYWCSPLLDCRAPLALAMTRSVSSKAGNVPATKRVTRLKAYARICAMKNKAKAKKTAAMPPIVAFNFDGKGDGSQVVPADLGKSRAAGAFSWVHLHGMDAKAVAWLHQCGVNPDVVAALTAEETRPRCTVHGAGAVLNLRGVNLNPGAEPEDMISIRLWIEDKRVISVWMRPLEAVQDVIDGIERNNGPVTVGDLVARLALRLADRAEPVVAMLNEQIDDLEEQVLDDVVSVHRRALADVRRMSIVLRRYMFPQRDALTTLEIEDLAWLGDRERSRLREAAERVTRLGEELDTIRDRAQIVHDQIMDTRAENMNRQMLVLTVVAAVFLPLGLLTGLLGINVGGVPGADQPYAFWVVCVILVVLGVAQALFFRHFTKR